MIRIDEPPKDETELDALRREIRQLTAIVRDIHTILVNSNVGRQARSESNQLNYFNAVKDQIAQQGGR